MENKHVFALPTDGVLNSIIQFPCPIHQNMIMIDPTNLSCINHFLKGKSKHALKTG